MHGWSLINPSHASYESQLLSLPHHSIRTHLPIYSTNLLLLSVYADVKGLTNHVNYLGVRTLPKNITILESQITMETEQLRVVKRQITEIQSSFVTLKRQLIEAKMKQNHARHNHALLTTEIVRAQEENPAIRESIQTERSASAHILARHREKKRNCETIAKKTERSISKLKKRLDEVTNELTTTTQLIMRKNQKRILISHTETTPSTFAFRNAQIFER
jgi:chromosome segregation ATPase